MRPTRAEILAAVVASPLGLTTRELAAQLCCPMSQVSTTVSKLAAYFLIDREPVAGNRRRRIVDLVEQIATQEKRR